MSSIKQNIEIALRLLLALLFIFSGGAKSIDCVGTSLYVVSHLEALHLGALSTISELLAVLLGGVELALGLLLLLNIMPRVTRFAAMAMLALFTLVTLLNGIGQGVVPWGFTCLACKKIREWFYCRRINDIATHTRLQQYCVHMHRLQRIEQSDELGLLPCNALAITSNGTRPVKVLDDRNPNCAILIFRRYLLRR